MANHGCIIKKERQLILEKHVKEKDRYQTVKQLYEADKHSAPQKISHMK